VPFSYKIELKASNNSAVYFFINFYGSKKVQQRHIRPRQIEAKPFFENGPPLGDYVVLRFAIPTMCSFIQGDKKRGRPSTLIIDTQQRERYGKNHLQLLLGGQ
jgi:hypothetical protein